MIELEGFTVVKNDRCNGKRGGGIYIYVRRDLCHRIISKTNNVTSLEGLFIEKILPTEKKSGGMCVQSTQM